MTQKHPPVHREGVRTLAVVRGMEEDGGINSKTEEPQDQEFCGRDYWEGAFFYRDAPHPPSVFQVLTAAQSGIDASGARETGQSESGAYIHALTGSRWMRAAIEVSLPPTGQAASAPSVAIGVAREGESTSTQAREAEEGQGAMLKGDNERIRRSDLESGGEERHITWGQVIWSYM